MRSKFIIVTLLFFTGCVSQGGTGKPSEESTYEVKKYSNDKKGEAMLMTNKALQAFRTKYKEASAHKAFAQSVSGSWSWSADRTSEGHAKTNALVHCQFRNKKYESSYPCRIINVNGNWVE